METAIDARGADTAMSHEIVIAGENTPRMLQAPRGRFVPNKIVLMRPGGAESPPITKIDEFTRDQECVNANLTAHACLNYARERPWAAFILIGDPG